jgi:hypothetical protein
MGESLDSLLVHLVSAGLEPTERIAELDWQESGMTNTSTSLTGAIVVDMSKGGSNGELF